MNDTTALRQRFQDALDRARHAEALFDYVMRRCPRVAALLGRCAW